MIIQRYTFYASAVDGDDGEYVLYTAHAAHAAEVERLTAEAYITKCVSDSYMAALEKIAAERDAAVATKERAVEALRDLYKSLLIHEGEDIMGRVKGTWSSKAAEKACVFITSSIAGPAPATKGEGDE